MMKAITLDFVAAALLAWIAGACSVAFAPPLHAAEADSKREVLSAKPKLDHTGRKRVGEASIYSKKLTGQTMADGSKMDPHDDNAASKTLPLGTKAKVTNLETGQSAKVTIQDRGPYVDGRIIDLSPSTARKIGLSKEEGVAKVEVKPLKIPMPDGSMKSAADARQQGK